jgi:hypothetical protein
VHGPCEVTSATVTSCNQGATGCDCPGTAMFPITQTVYYSPTAGSNKSNQPWKTIRLTGARQGHLRAPSQPLLPSSRPRRAPLQVAVPRANLDPGRLSRTVYTGGAAGLRGEARRAGQSG